MKNVMIISSIVALVIGGVFLLSRSQMQPGSNQTQKEEAQTGEISPHYVWYSKEELTKAQAKGRAVLYFWAAWCPTCKALNEELIQRSRELPNDVTILKTNYDTEDLLKKKYQIVVQHTLVQIDKNGNEVTRWSGGNINVINQELK